MVRIVPANDESPVQENPLGSSQTGSNHVYETSRRQCQSDSFLAIHLEIVLAVSPSAVRKISILNTNIVPYGLFETLKSD